MNTEKVLGVTPNLGHTTKCNLFNKSKRLVIELQIEWLEKTLNLIFHFRGSYLKPRNNSRQVVYTSYLSSGLTLYNPHPQRISNHDRQIIVRSPSSRITY